jgi:error-prone DNA polymerase
MDYTATGLTLRKHPLALLRPALTKLGYHDARHLNTARPDSSIRLCGFRRKPARDTDLMSATVPI